MSVNASYVLNRVAIVLLYNMRKRIDRQLFVHLERSVNKMLMHLKMFSTPFAYVSLYMVFLKNLSCKIPSHMCGMCRCFVHLKIIECGTENISKEDQCLKN